MSYINMLEKSREKTLEGSNRMRTESDLYKTMTSPLTQNFKTLGLWVLFLICYAQISHFYSMWDLNSHLNT